MNGLWQRRCSVATPQLAYPRTDLRVREVQSVLQQLRCSAAAPQFACPYATLNTPDFGENCTERCQIQKYYTNVLVGSVEGQIGNWSSYRHVPGSGPDLV